MKPIATAKAPAAIGPYSQAIHSAAGLVFVSGQLPIDPATGAFPEGGVEAQTRQSLLNARAILQEAGLDLDKVVKTTVFLADMGDFAAMNGVYSQFFREPFPARSERCSRRDRVHRRGIASFCRLLSANSFSVDTI